MRAEPLAMYGVVLAAGRSTRMGRPKALLMREGRPLVARAAEVLAGGGCAGVFVVAPEGDADVRAAAAQAGTVVVAPDMPGAEPIDSLRCALAALPPDTVVAAVLPVDCPFVRPDTVRLLAERLRERDADAAVPVWSGVDGHPALLHRRLFARIGEGHFEQGVRTLLADPSVRVERVPVDDAGVTEDLDTPEDARRLGVTV